MDTEDREWLVIAEVAELTKRSTKTVYSWIKKGYMKSRRIESGQYTLCHLVHRDEVRNFKVPKRGKPLGKKRAMVQVS